MTYKERFMKDNSLIRTDDAERIIRAKCPHDYYPELEAINTVCCSRLECRKCWEKEVMNAYEIDKKVELMARIACADKTSLMRIEESMMGVGQEMNKEMVKEAIMELIQQVVNGNQKAREELSRTRR